MSTAPYQWSHGDLLLRLWVQPNTKKNQWLGVHDGAFRIRIQAAAVEGRANAMLIDFLAKQFGVKKSAVTLLGGETGRRKKVLILKPKTLPAEIEHPIE